MRVLVTGGAGFIGSHLVDLLVSRGHEVSVLDNLDPQVHGPAAELSSGLADQVQSGAVRFHRGDVTDMAVLEGALGNVEAVVHLAAAVGVGQSMYEPLYYVHTNDLGTGMLLQLLVARKKEICRLVVASSMSLYGEGAYHCAGCGGGEPGPRTQARLAAGRFEVPCAACGLDLDPLPTPETKVPEIHSVYAATKKHQEDLFTSFGQAYGISTFALRFFNVFGARQSLANPYTGVAAIFLSRLLAGRAPLIFEDGRQSRDFIDVRDVARALLLTLEHPAQGVFVLNVGTGRRMEINQVAAALAQALGVAIQPERLGRFRSGDIRHCIADTRLAERVLGFSAEHSLESGLEPLIDWCRTAATRDLVESSLAELRRQDLVK